MSEEGTLEALLAAFEAREQGLIDAFEARVDTQEQLISNLLMSYVELAASVEVIMAQLLEGLSTEEQAAFATRATEKRRAMLSWLQTLAEQATTEEDFHLRASASSPLGPLVGDPEPPLRRDDPDPGGGEPRS